MREGVMEVLRDAGDGATAWWGHRGMEMEEMG